MNKAALIGMISKDAGITRVQATTALDTFFGGVTSSLKRGQRVTFVGFGTFGVNKRKARIGRNPQTGAAIKIKAKKAVKFKAGKELEKQLNK